MSYRVCFSFCKVFCVSHHISCPTVWVSHFSCFLLFLAIFQVLYCVSHFALFRCFSPY
jgi:hypothetical protein